MSHKRLSLDHLTGSDLIMLAVCVWIALYTAVALWP